MISRTKRIMQSGAVRVTRENEREIRNAKAVLKLKGWSYRRAAKHLGYSYTHFAWVLSGRRFTHRVIEAINGLPERKEVANAN